MAVILVVPIPFAVTTPLLDIDAIFEFSLVHTIFLFVAFVGVIIGVNCVVFPFSISIFVLSKEIFVTFTNSSIFLVVIFIFDVNFPSSVFAVIVTSPSWFAITFIFPSLSIFTKFSLLLSHIIFLLLAFSCFTSSFFFLLSPYSNS